MSSAKYSAITADLELKVRHGAYREKLPTTREMAVQFGVSRQTVTNALRPLIQKGLLIADRRNGVKVNIKRLALAHGMIGITARADIDILNTSPTFKPLRKRINADGFESSMLDVSDGITHLDSNSLEKFAGLIFTNSSLTLEMAKYLEQKHIPFVSCNRLPVYSRLNYAEYDWGGAIKKIASLFAMKGYRNQGLFFPGQLMGYNKSIKNQWKSIKLELGLPLMEADEFESSRMMNRLVCLEKYLKNLHAARQYPQLLILWMGIDKNCAELVRQGEYKLPDSCLVAGPSDSSNIYGKNIFTFKPKRIDVMLAAYESLRGMLLAPSKKLIHRFIDHPITWHNKNQIKELAIRN
jgi:DNA-binding transcriptional ArsR family regulator